MMKKIIRFLLDVVIKCVYLVFEAYIWLLKWTMKYKIQGEEIINEYRDKKEPFIMALWHESLLVPMCYLGGRDIHVLVSSHRTTLRFMHEVVERFDWKMIKTGNGDGKTSRDSQNAKALVLMIKAIKEGKDLVLTPDGTSGPVHKIKPGLLYVAMKTGAPIILFGVAADPSWHLPTWDKFLMPCPYATGSIVFGKPNYLPKKMTDEEFQAKTEELENELQELQRKAKELLRK